MAPNHAFAQVEAQEAIDTAQTVIHTAFGKLTQADLAGADIRDLVADLNSAIRDLDLARVAFSNSDFSSAMDYAESAQSTAEEVFSEAQSREVVANTNSMIQVLLIVVVIVTAVIVAYFLLTRWRKQKHRHTRALLRMEIRLPEEEVSDE
jgi:hypothetical protein